MNADYRHALDYLYSFINYETLPGAAPEKRNLVMIERLVEGLGHPERQWPSIHVTGTKGKGSTAVMIASMVRRSGYRVGLYTSPHLVTFRERIMVDGEMISEEAFCALVDKIRPVVEDVARGVSEPPTFFDVWTALAFLCFADRQVDLAVVEVGLGGRLDSTNVITPVVSVITPIGLDHTDRLGTTLPEIAYEKAGIIKKGVSTVCGPQIPEALSVIQDTCRTRNSALYLVGADIRYSTQRADVTGQVFDVEGRKGRYTGLETSLLGTYQVINAATAVGAVEMLDGCGIAVPTRGIADGLRTVVVPGRLQVVQKDPWMVLDGAHNVLSAATLAQSIQKLFPHRRAILVVSLHRDKDVVGICRALSVVADEVIVATRRVMKRRQADPEMVAAAFRALDRPVTVTPSVSAALDLAQAIAGTDDLICVTGSFVMVGETMEVLQKLEPEELLSR